MDEANREPFLRRMLLDFLEQRRRLMALKIKTWFEVPGFGSISHIDEGYDGSIVIPAGFDRDLGPVSLFSVTSAFPLGTYGYDCRLLDPVTGESRSLDQNAFEIE